MTENAQRLCDTNHAANNGANRLISDGTTESFQLRDQVFNRELLSAAIYENRDENFSSRERHIPSTQIDMNADLPPSYEDCIMRS